YDEDGNEQIDIDELKVARGTLTEDLRKKWEERDGEEDSGKGNKLNKIVEAIRGLEKEVTEYPVDMESDDEKEQIEENDLVAQIEVLSKGNN
ncbi:10995_t:CDS:2, partial [Paraglomus brasilianum]